MQVAVFLLAVGWALPGGAVTRYVNQRVGSNGNSGTDSLTDAWLTIQYAISHVADGDTIQVSNGIYVENVTNASLNLATLQGGYNDTTWAWAPAVNRSIIKAANGAADVLTVNGTNNTVKGFTLTGGARGVYTTYGGNQNLGTYLTLMQCVVSNNTSHGLQADNAMRVNIINGLLVRNGGQGVYLNQGNASYASSTFYACTIADNSVGGLRVDARYSGVNPFTTVKNCMLVGNGGYGIYRYSTFGDANPVTNAYCCLYSNANGNVQTSVSSSYVIPGAGILCANPLLVGNGNYTLQSGSPCVQAGADLSGLGITDDLTGAARSGWDMGCYESGFSPAPRYGATWADASKADDSGNGTTQGTAKRTIGAAMAITQSGGTCTVLPGLYNEPVFVRGNVALQGQSSQTTVLSNGWQAVSMAEAGSTVTAFRILGPAGSIGVGIYGTSNLLSESAVSTATNSGSWGVYVQGATNSIVHCQISNNYYGVYYLAGASAVGAYALRLDRCQISSNRNYGVYVSRPNPIAGPISLQNLLVTGNGSDGLRLELGSYGGGYPLPNTVFYCTVADNGGNGLYVSGRYTSTIVVSNSICAQNGGYGIARKAGFGDGHLLYVGYSCLYTNTSGGFSNDFPGVIVYGNGLITNAAPQFLGYSVSPYGLTPASPCRDATPNIGITNDLVGTLRPVRSVVPPTGLDYDMGAYEMSRRVTGTLIFIQ